MDINTIKELVKIMGSSGLESMEVEIDGFKVKLKNCDSAAVRVTSSLTSSPLADIAGEAPEETHKDGIETINSPMVGVFNPVQDAQFSPGDEIPAGTVVATIEAMKMINEVEAPYKCIFESYCVNPGQTVEYNQPLVEVRRA